MIHHGSFNNLKDLRTEVDRTVTNLERRKDEFDSIAVTGMSGVVVGVPVSLALDKPLVIFRSDPSVVTKTCTPVNIAQLGKRALFLDDLISGGKTRNRVRADVEKHNARVVATYTYFDHHWQDHTRGRVFDSGPLPSPYAIPF